MSSRGANTRVNAPNGPIALPIVGNGKQAEVALSGLNDDEKFDYDLIQAQLRIAQASQLLQEKGHGHGLGDERPASLSSQPSDYASTPELVHGGTPSEGGSVAQTPGLVDLQTRARLQHALDSDLELEKILLQIRAQRENDSRAGSDYFTSTNQSGNASVREESDEELEQHRASQPARTYMNLVRSSPDDKGQVAQPRQSRSSSFTTPSRRASTAHKRRSSLPAEAVEQGAHYTFFAHEAPQRDLIRPAGPPPIPTGPKPDPDLSDGTSDSAATAAVAQPPQENEKSQGAAAGKDESPKPSMWSRLRSSYVATYAPVNPPDLILPTAPSDEEKISYLTTNRVVLYSFGVLSFLSLSAGMWLFVVSAIPFYWFGLMVVLLQAYLFVSYAVSLVGKDFDYKNHQKVLEENPILPESCPTIDIYLPCCKEPIDVLENTYKHVQKLEWPAGKLKVYVLDDGADENVKALATSYGYEYILREDRPRLKKAGNLRWAFARTTGDFFNIYDADFCPRPDFLKEIIPHHLAYPKTAIVQTPQYFRVKEEQTWVEQGAGAVQELFYRVIQVNRNRWGASICVGSNAVYRREALVEVGGTAEIGFSEDVHTGFYALTRGWEVRYVPLCLACGICPDTPRAFFSQQMRWCMGSTTLLTNPEFWKSPLTVMQKICYLSGMMYYSAISLSIFLNPLPGILMIWVRPDYVRYYNLAFAVPSLIYSLIAIRCWAKARYGLAVQFVMCIQTFAYFTAIKDRLIGRGLAWVPSGDTKAHKNNKYRNMRILAWVWMSSALAALVAGVTYQTIKGLDWYDAFPTLLLAAFNFFLAHRFLLCHGKL